MCREIFSAGAKPAKNVEVGAFRPLYEIQHGDLKGGGESPLLADVMRLSSSDSCLYPVGGLVGCSVE